MCGIVAVLRRPSARTAPDAGRIGAELDRLVALLERAADTPVDILPGDLHATAEQLSSVDAELRSTPGLRCLLGDPAGASRIAETCRRAWSLLDRIEGALEAATVSLTPSSQEAYNAALTRLRDGFWSIQQDRIGMAHAVAALAGGRAALDEANLEGWWSIQVALGSLDRLEVRGRDSAGLHVLVAGHGLDPKAAEVKGLLAGRDLDPLFRSGSVRLAQDCIGFVYKAAAEIGELGDNVRALRSQITSDPLLALALAAAGARVCVIGHTRWASVGAISEPNAHPLDSLERPDSDWPAAGWPYVVGALNGDVDNHADLSASEGLGAPAEITTDAKVIPTLVSRGVATGLSMDEAFLSAVNRFEGSVAIAASSAGEPDALQLALRGSGQALYVGLAEDSFVVASEPYGLVEETSVYLRMDGESSSGHVVTLTRDQAGALEGIRRRRYDGTLLAVDESELETAEVTTRDIDRGGFKHYLLKELYEAPASMRKTIRGRIVAGPSGQLEARVGEETVPPAIATALADGRVSKVVVIGQGTAAVAGRAVAAAFQRCLPGLSTLAMPATELSGFGLSDDMSDTLVVAVSQSGTTTDTNRTVDLVRTRGAYVVSIVNRRHSDLVAKSHGVLYTSDGRDVEMSVASTKAFYAQVAAGWILAAALARLSGRSEHRTAADAGELLAALRELPSAMERILAGREQIGRIAAVTAPPRRYWAVVGSGPDQLAAAEVRIKLSELCYRSISYDTTEDKKHIDLSCEPMILVCGAGLRGTRVDDVAKEVAIYRAHRAAPIVIASESDAGRFQLPAGDLIVVPDTLPALAFMLAAMAGHIFGYEAAVSIDALARPLREVRAALEEALTEEPHDDPLARLQERLEALADPFVTGLREGTYNGNLEAATAVDLVSLLRYATGMLPLEGYESETGKIGSPSVLLTDLLAALNRAIDELTRPIDAIKHQAKTVTVGISRSEEALLGASLVRATLAAGPAPDTLGYRALKTLAALDEAVAEVLGYTRYRIDWGAPTGPVAAVIDQTGSLAGVESRTASDPRLRGTKHRAAEEREVTVAVGAGDGRELVMVPEAKGGQVTGMTLLHVRFLERLDPEAAKRVLLGYRKRYAALSDAVTETEPVFDDSVLGQVPPVELLTHPVHLLADRWRERAVGEARR